MEPNSDPYQDDYHKVVDLHPNVSLRLPVSANQIDDSLYVQLPMDEMERHGIGVCDLVCIDIKAIRRYKWSK